MSEQLTFDEMERTTASNETLPADFETLFDKLNEILEAARDKYSYHKMHISGMYEMVKAAPSGELYEIMELRDLKDKSIAFLFDSQLYIKFVPKKERVCMTKEIYHEFLQDAPAQELKRNGAPKGGVSVEMPFTAQIDFFPLAIDYLVKHVKPANRFGCCSKYAECSAKRQCVHENAFYSKGCAYRDNIENGTIFY